MTTLLHLPLPLDLSWGAVRRQGRCVVKHLLVCDCSCILRGCGWRLLLQRSLGQ